MRGLLLTGTFNDLLVGGAGNLLSCLYCSRSAPEGIVHGYASPSMNAYVQDDWKVSSKLDAKPRRAMGIQRRAQRQVRQPHPNLGEPHPGGAGTPHRTHYFGPRRKPMGGAQQLRLALRTTAGRRADQRQQTRPKESTRR